MANQGGGDGGKDGLTSGNFPLCPTGHRPFWAAAQKPLGIQKYCVPSAARCRAARPRLKMPVMKSQLKCTTAIIIKKKKNAKRKIRTVLTDGHDANGSATVAFLSIQEKNRGRTCGCVLQVANVVSINYPYVQKEKQKGQLSYRNSRKLLFASDFIVTTARKKSQDTHKRKVRRVPCNREV